MLLEIEHIQNIAYDTIEKIKNHQNKKGKFDAAIVVMRNNGSLLGMYLSGLLPVPTFFIKKGEKFLHSLFEEDTIKQFENIILIDDEVNTGLSAAEICQSYNIKAIASLHFRAEAQKIEGIDYFYGLLIASQDEVSYPWII